MEDLKSEVQTGDSIKQKYKQLIINYFDDNNSVDYGEREKLFIYEIVLGIGKHEIDWSEDFYTFFLENSVLNKLLSDLNVDGKCSRKLIQAILSTIIRVVRDSKNTLNVNNKSIIICEICRLYENVCFEERESTNENEDVCFEERESTNENDSFADDQFDIIDLILLLFQMLLSSHVTWSQQESINLINVLISSLNLISKEEEPYITALSLIGQLINQLEDCIINYLREINYKTLLKFGLRSIEVDNRHVGRICFILESLCKQVQSDFVHRCYVDRCHHKEKISLKEVFRFSTRIVKFTQKIFNLTHAQLTSSHQRESIADTRQLSSIESSASLTRLLSMKIMDADDISIYSQLGIPLPLDEIERNFQCDDSMWLGSLFATMVCHQADDRKQQAACRSLVHRIQSNPSIVNLIGEENYQIGIHSVVMATLHIHIREAFVFKAACDVIFQMSVNSSCVQSLFIVRGAYLTIINEMKTFKNDAEAHMYGYRALRGLSYQNPLLEEVLFKYGLLNLFDVDMSQFADDVPLHKEIFCLLASLATNLQIVRRQCLNSRLPQRIFTFVTKFSENEDLVDVGLETIAIFCASEETTLRTLTNVTSLRKLAHLHTHNCGILQKVCVVFQLIVIEESFLQNDDVIKEILCTVKTILDSCHDSDNLLTECIILLVLLLDDSRENFTSIMTSIVETEVNVNLLDIFETYPSYEDVHGFVKQCLTHFSSLQKLCDITFLQSCRHGYNKSARFLIDLNANIDAEWDDWDPAVCVATKNGNVKLVEVLLSLQTAHACRALRVALDEGLDEVAGTLLRHLGYERRNNSISWSAMQIKQLNAEMFFSTIASSLNSSDEFNQQQTYVKTSLVGRRKRSSTLTLAEDIKKVNLRRKRTFSLFDENAQKDLKRNVRTASGIMLPYNASDPRLSNVNTSKKHVVMTTPTSNSHYPGHPDIALFTEPSTGIFISSENNSEVDTLLTAPKRTKFKKSLSDENFGELVCKDDTSLPPQTPKRTPSTPPRERTRSCLPAFYQNKIDAIKLLDISHNAIGDLNSLGECPSRNLSHFLCNLSYVDVSNNQIEILPECFCARLKSIKSIAISRNKIREFPYALLRNSSLEVLDLSNNEIVEIDKRRLKLSLSLLKLDLTSNNISSFPTWISEYFPRLARLFLAQNKIQVIPDDTPGFRGLQELKLSSNGLECLPGRFLSQCVSLEKLDLSCNQLDSFPDYTVSTLCRLTSIKLSHNNLKARAPYFLPKILLSVPTLQIIDLSYNNIEQVPDPSYWASKVIRELRFDHNKVVELNLSPNAGQMWPSITRLSLSNNCIQTLSPNIGHLSSLMSLDISYNRITTLPNEMGRLKQLCDFRIHGLKLKLHPALSKAPPQHIMQALRAKLKKAVPYNRIKLMLVGKGNRGKTSLIRQIAFKKHPTINIATVGVEVRNWMLKTSRFRCTKSIMINSWDFGGQEDFYSTHQYFLTSRALYIAVFDCSKGVSEIDLLTPWMLNIRAVAPEAAVVLVGTHADKIPREKRRDHANMIFKYAQDFFKKPGMPKILAKALVSCLKETRSIEMLREKLFQVISSMRYEGESVIDQMVPKSYLDLEEIIQKEAELYKRSAKLPVVSKQLLWKLVLKKGLHSNQDEFESALKFLKDTGTLMHFADSKLNLSSLYFIDPQWLCAMMAKVVTVKEVNPFITDKGIFSKDDALILFSKENYPKSFFDQYFRLLQKFEILLPVSPTKYLITSRVPQEIPQHLTIRREEIIANHDAIQRRYTFAYVPNGLWSRLITRTLVYADYSTVDAHVEFWSKGVYICWPENVYLLLISGVEDDNIIDIYLPLNQPGCKILGALIDLVDNLIEEWYPGLEIPTPGSNSKVERFSACYACSEKVHYFPLNDVIYCSYESDTIQCPNCGPVLIEAVAPDVVFAEISSSLIIPQCEIQYNDEKVCSLGSGSFASVYKVTVEGEVLAVKVFNDTDDGVTANRLLRQELEILSKLSHPCLISFVGVSLRPRMILLEYAPLGNLQDVIDSGRTLSRGMQHRVSLQITEGLAYLHKFNIVYRDMKPTNILVFSLSMGVLVNVKLSDYGISQYAGMMGLVACKGTPGYQAPEIAQYSFEYKLEVDIFSLGVTLYEIVTLGKQPYGEIPYQNELDRVALSERPIDSITLHGFTPWPDMEDLISSCLAGNPDERPTANEILERLSNVELLCLQRASPICKSQSVECLAIRKFVEDNEEKLELWVGSGEAGSQSQLSWLPLRHYRKQSSVQGLMLTEGRILCMEVVRDEVFVGTKEGSIVAFDCRSKTKVYELEARHDSVLCLKYIVSRDLLIAGLADGFICVYQGKSMKSTGCAPLTLNCNESKPSPVTCLASNGNFLFVGCGKRILEINMSTLTLNRVCDVSTRGLVNNLQVCRKKIFLSLKNEHVIKMIDYNSFKECADAIDISEIMRSKMNDVTLFRCRIVSMLIPDNETLWVGCGDGCTVLIDITQEQTFDESSILLHRHSSAVRSIISSGNISGKSGHVITGSKGYHPGVISKKIDDNCEAGFGYVLVWDVDIPKRRNYLKNDVMKRKELADKMI